VREKLEFLLTNEYMHITLHHTHPVMLMEIKQISDRYLLCNYFFSDSMIKKVKADVKRFMADREKDDLYYKRMKPSFHVQFL